MAFAGLYGDLPSAKDQNSDDADKEKKKEGWAGSGLFAPVNLAAKRQVALAPPSVLRAAAAGGRGRGREGPLPVALGGRGGRGGGAPGSDAGGGGSMLLAAASSEDGPITVIATAAPTLMPGISLGEAIKDEYDPSKPNDYDVVRRAREQQRREAEMEAARQERLREEQERELQRQRQEEERRQEEEERRQEEEERLREVRELEALELAQVGGDEPAQQRVAHPDGAPQQQQTDEQRRAVLQLSGDEAWKRRGMLTQPGGGDGGGGGDGWGPGGLVGGLGSSGGGLGLSSDSSAAPGPAGGASGRPKGMSLAQRMLERMGWKEGEGLGRNRQGMATPLMMQKTDVRSGVIVNAVPPTAAQPPTLGAFPSTDAPEQPAKRQRSATFNRPPTRVVLLTNMIGPGEVDKELDREVGEECSKYGAVTNVMIFEVTEPGFPSDQSVRIFVQFDRTEAATKALVDLQGRFFGGREVEAQFFEEERFEALELAPRPEEVRH